MKLLVSLRSVDGDIWLTAGAYFLSYSQAHICMAFPRKPVQNYWQTLVRCDFQLNPLPRASEETGWPGRPSGASWEFQATQPPCGTHIGQSF